jgi:hypothetical protein
MIPIFNLGSFMSASLMLSSWYEPQMLGVYDWSGNNPILPELWIAPQFLPFHPGIPSIKCCRSNFLETTL